MSFVSVGTCFFLQKRREIDWRGGDYNCSVERECLTSLPLVTDASARRWTHAAFLALRHANKSTQAPQTKWKRCIGRSSFKWWCPHTQTHTQASTHAHRHARTCMLVHLSVVHYSSEAVLLLLEVFTTRNTLVAKRAALQKWIFSWINMHITALSGTASQPEPIPRS